MRAFYMCAGTHRLFLCLEMSSSILSLGMYVFEDSPTDVIVTFLGDPGSYPQELSEPRDQ